MSGPTRVAVAFCGWSLAGCASAIGPRDPVVPVGLRKQLLLDDYVIAECSNVTRELGRVIKANDGRPILTAEEPWEDADLLRLGSVFRDGGRFRMWYACGEHTAYAESHDGLHWTKPKLGSYEYGGSRENNIVDPRGFTCFLDPHETDPAHRYKAAYAHETVRAALAHSPDGFHWTSYNGGRPVTGRAADTLNQLLWDEECRVYRLYTRTDFGEGLYAGTLDENRGTRDMTNPDVKADPTAWTTVRQWKFDREGRWEYKRRQVYSLNGWRYAGVHFGLLWCYEWPGMLGEGPYDLHRRHERDIMNFYILTARGDEMWNLDWIYAEKPLIPRGPDGSFDKDWVQPATNIVTWQDRHWIYYSGSRERHDIYRIREGQSRWQCAIGLATLRLDGFVCLEAKDEPGLVLTKPFRLEAGTLDINVDAGRGEVSVEVLDRSGQPIDGYSQAQARPARAVDEVRYRPRWEDHPDLSALRGQVVRLRFRLRNARLYAFHVHR